MLLRIVAAQELAIAVALLVSTGCAATSDCLEQHQVRRPSPSSDRVAVIYPGGCADYGPPQIRVDFGQRGGGLVFAARDSVASLDAHWVTNDTLVIAYPTSVAVDEQRTFSQYGDDKVTVIYQPTRR